MNPSYLFGSDGVAGSIVSHRLSCKCEPVQSRRPHPNHEGRGTIGKAVGTAHLRGWHPRCNPDENPLPVEVGREAHDPEENLLLVEMGIFMWVHGFSI
jgi:hypothetical protein